jgi:hypothetical protein
MQAGKVQFWFNLKQQQVDFGLKSNVPTQISARGVQARPGISAVKILEVQVLKSHPPFDTELKNLSGGENGTHQEH